MHACIPTPWSWWCNWWCRWWWWWCCSKRELLASPVLLLQHTPSSLLLGPSLGLPLSFKGNGNPCMAIWPIRHPHPHAEMAVEMIGWWWWWYFEISRFVRIVPCARAMWMYVCVFSAVPFFLISTDFDSFRLVCWASVFFVFEVTWKKYERAWI